MPNPIVIGGLRYEANSFAPGVAGLDAFRRGHVIVDGAVLEADYADELSGARAAACAAGMDVVGAFDAWGGSGPKVADSAYEALRDDLVSRIAALRGGVDGVFLSLHGAMCTESLDDPEGDLLVAVRQAVGDVPIAVTLDLHCHLTPQMVEAVDIAVAFETCPHVDFVDTGRRAMNLLVGALRGDVAPVVQHRRLPLIAPSESHDTNRAPMADIMRLARRCEARAGVLSVSVCPTQPWLDVVNLGLDLAVVVDGCHSSAESVAADVLDELAQEIWRRRHRLTVSKPSTDEALARVRNGAPPGPVVIADGGDSPSAGSTGDGVTLLRALLDHGFSDEPCCVIVTDAAAVRQCHEAGVGSEVQLSLGGTLAPTFFEPVNVSATVETLSPARYMSHYPPGPVDRGWLAVVALGEIRVVITELPAMQLDQALYRRAGIDLEAMRVVGVKSAGGYRARYAPLAVEMIDVAGPGPASSELATLPFRRIRRPLFPLDDWEALT